MTRDEILKAHPLVEHLRSAGVKLTGREPNLRADRCPLKQHSRSDTVSVDSEKQVFHCFGCDARGSVLDWMALAEGVPVAEILKRLGANGSTKPAPPATGVKLSKTYYYRDANGEVAYKVCRYEPKTFRPFHRGENGESIAGLEGVTRVLYNLPQVIEAETVAILEGEKDADTLAALNLGIAATTNCSGAESWLDSYADSLTGKHVVLLPDQDEKGEKHAAKVIASIMGKALTIRRVNVPKPHKDVSDYVLSVGEEKAKSALLEWIAGAKIIRPGHDLPFKDIHELEQNYREHVSQMETNSIDLARWLPSLKCLRKLVPGDMVAMLADTGTGKTALAVNLVHAAHPMPTLVFELELGEEMTFERFLQTETETSGHDIERAYIAKMPPPWKASHRLGHFLYCTETKLTPDRIEELIEKSELRLGQRPRLIVIDYIGLLDDVGSDRYERLSNVAEKLRLIAKRTKTVVVITSQVKRRGNEADNTTPIGLHDAKNTGSIENSASVVLGAWRDADEAGLLTIGILKASRGGAGKEIYCNFNGDKMLITERADR